MGSEKSNRFRAALVQMRAGRVVEENLISAEAMIREAAKGGADYIQTPENTALMELEPELVRRQVQPEPESRPLSLFRALAKELRVWLHIGSAAGWADRQPLLSLGARWLRRCAL
jgi:predicted amidohydrolase